MMHHVIALVHHDCRVRVHLSALHAISLPHPPLSSPRAPLWLQVWDYIRSGELQIGSEGDKFAYDTKSDAPAVVGS